MTERDDSQPRGDLADQATDSIFAAEQAAIRAALRGRGGDAVGEPVEDTDVRDSSMRLPDEPQLDLGDGDDSDDAVHAGGDDVATTASGAPDEQFEEIVRAVDAREAPPGQSLPDATASGREFGSADAG